MNAILRQFYPILGIAASLAAFAPPISAFDWRDPVAAKNREANALAAQDKLDEALDLYKEAQVESPGTPALHYNIGAALARKNEYEQALESLQKVSDAPPSLEANRYYNEGRIYLGQALEASKGGDSQAVMAPLKKAVEANREALKRAPGQPDFQFNYELAARMLKELQQQQQQQQPQKQNDKNDQSQDQKDQQDQEQQNNSTEQNNQNNQNNQNGQQSKADEQKQDQGREQQQDQAPPSEKQQQKQEQQTEAQQQEGLTPEQARRLLNQLGDEDPNAFARLFRPDVMSARKWDKDW